MPRQLSPPAHAIVIAGVAIGAFFAHELGHALVAQLLGARIAMFNVLGMQWYPRLEWMPEIGYGGYVYWFAPADRTIHWLIVLAGSTSTLLIACTAVIGLTLLPVRGLARTALAVLSLYFLDGFVHLLPVLGLNWLGNNSRFIKSFAEAYTAAVALGIPGAAYISFVLLTSALIVLLLARALFKPTPALVLQFKPSVNEPAL